MSQMLEKSFYLIVPARKSQFGRRYELQQPRVVSDKNPPKVKPGEVAIKCSVQLPEALFKEPQFRATIVVGDEAVTPQVVDAEVINNIQQVVAEATGIQLTIESTHEED